MMSIGLTHRLAEGAPWAHRGHDGLGMWFRAGRDFLFWLGLNKRGLGMFAPFYLQSDLVELHRGYIISSDWE